MNIFTNGVLAILALCTVVTAFVVIMRFIVLTIVSIVKSRKK